MKSRMKKLLSVLLAMVIAFVPAGAGTAWADEDTTAPEWVAGYPKAQSVGDKEFSLEVQSNEAGRAYYVRLTDGALPPTGEQVAAGQDASGNQLTYPQAGSIAVGTGGSSAVRVKGLTPNTPYDVYTVLKDGADNLQLTPTLIEVITTVPSEADSGITNQLQGTPGYKKVTLYVTVKNAVGIGSLGYLPEDFSVTVDGTPTTFAGSQFSGFYDSDNAATGFYSVVFTGAADDTMYTLTNLTVSGVVIEAGPITVTTPPAAATALATPTGLAWDGTTPGKAKWDTVTNASSYSLRLYKDDGAQGSAVSVSSGTEHDFTSAIEDEGTGSYTFKVTAIGNGTTYSDSPQSDASPQYNYTATASTPTITNAVMDAENDLITVTFSEGVYGDAANTTGINKDDFHLTFAQNAGGISGASIRWVNETIRGVSPTGGETQYDILIKLLDGPPSGTETITISPKADSIYSSAGIAVPDTESTGAVALHSLPAQSFADGYPKPGAPQPSGSHAIKVLAKVNLAGVLYNVLLPDGATPPTAQQIKDHADIDGSPVITWGQQLIGAETEVPVTMSNLLAHATNYDLYMVAQAGNNNFSQVGKVDVRTPTETDTLIDMAAIPGVTAPVTGATPVTEITETAQYTGTVSWSPTHSSFAAATTYTATITLTPKAGYTLTGAIENLFTVAGATSVTNATDSGVVTAVFPATAPLVSNVCEISANPVQRYSSLADALNDVEDGQTITLLDTINYSDNDGIVIDGKSVIFNLNGHTLNVGHSSANKGLEVINGGKLELWGDSGELNVTAYGNAVAVDGINSSATVTRTTSQNNIGAYATNGGSITVKGDATGRSSGISATGAGSKVTVGGDAKAMGVGGWAMDVSGGGQVEAKNASSIGASGKGVLASGVNSKAIVKGDVYGKTYGVDAGSSAEVTVEGNVSTDSSDANFGYGVWAQSKAKIRVFGNVSANNNMSSIGAYARSTAAASPTEIIIDGTISGKAYIKLGNTVKNNDPSDRTIPTSMSGYHTYTQTDADGTSTVWVKDTSAPPTGPVVWNYRSPLPAPNIMENAEFINGQYMAVGYNGILITSVDGVTWQNVPVGADSDRLSGIAHGSGRYVIVSTASDYVARIYTSDNGLSWHETAAIPNHWLYDVAYGDDGFVAVGQSGKILRSTDGENWDIITVDPMDYTLLGITYANGKYVAAGMRKHTGISHRGVVMTSEDGENWTVTHTNQSNILWDITNGGGTFVAVGGANTGSYYICTSSDGVAWTPRSNYGSSYANLLSVHYDGSRFIAVGRTNSGGMSGAYKAFTTVSANGITWTDRTDATKDGLSVVTGNASGSQHVAMGGTGNIYTSNDGGTIWTYNTLGGTKTLRDVAWNGSIYVAVGLEGLIQTSPDGETWTIRTSVTANDLYKVDYLNNQFIAVGKSGTILTSVNGTAWTAQTSGTNNDLLDIAYGEGLYVTGGNGVARISNNGIDWRAPVGLITLETVTYGNGVFVALTQTGRAFSSDDGENWSTCGELDRFAKYPKKVIYADGKFVAVGGYGEIFLSSNNGVNWTIIECGLTVYLRDVTYSGGNFAAVGGMGNIVASADGGMTWTVQPSGLTPSHVFGPDDGTELFGIADGDSSFVAVGVNGITLQSENFNVSTDRDAHDVALARPNLGIHNILGSGVNYNESYIVANMNLTTSGNNGTEISWVSSKPEYIAANGNVTRPSFSAGDQAVYLTATISKGSASTTKTFIVIVIVQPDPDISIVEQAVNALTFDVIKGSNTQTSNITSDLNLITDGGNGTSVSWSSNKPATIAADGTVTRPAQGASDETVTLTATVSKGTVIRTRTFNLTVKALVNADEDVAAAKTALTFDAIKGSNTAENNILSNLNLITSGANGTTVSWSSDKPVTLAADGTVTRPAQGERNIAVTLTATISKGSASDTKPFNLTVKAKSVLDVSGIVVKTQPVDLTYTAGETLDFSGLVVTLTYNDSTTLDVGFEDFNFMGITTNPDHGATLSAAGHHNQSVTVTCNGKTATTNNLIVTTAPSGDSGSGNGGSGGSSGRSGNSTPPANTSTITSDQINTQMSNNQSFELQHDGLQIAIDPEDLPSLPANGGSIQVRSSVVTEPNVLNTFFIQYPGQQGIMKGYNVTFTQQNSSGQSEDIIQLNGEITLTFRLTPAELAGIDPSTLVVYKRAEDGSIAEFNAVFDWSTNSLRISTSHLCEFYIMGEKGIPTQRLAGVNRYETAATISAHGWQTSDNVVLASGENFPDALAGTVLAGVKAAPVLLTTKEALSSETLVEIRRLKAKNIYLLGGTSVIAKSVEDLLARDYTVIRVSGANRYETAVRIGELVMKTDTAIIATGSDYPDALSVASFAGQNGLPILFTETDGLNALTAEALRRWGIKKVILVGGAGVISVGVETILRDEMKLSVTRLSGTDRYRTGLEIAKYFAGNQPGSYQYAALATGSNFPDALAGASLTAKLKMPVLLVGKETVNTEIKDYLQGLDLEKVYLFGGQGTVPDSVKEDVSKN